jgi:hypothetical protein
LWSSQKNCPKIYWNITNLLLMNRQKE